MASDLPCMDLACADALANSLGADVELAGCIGDTDLVHRHNTTAGPRQESIEVVFIDASRT